MKTVLLTIFILVSLSSFSQITIKQAPPSTAGRELRKASNQFYTGFFMTIGGGLITYATRNQSDKTLQQLGGLIVTAGAIVSITSWIHVNKAGKLLDNKLSASIGGNGILIRYSF